MNTKVYKSLINLLKKIYYEDKNIVDSIELVKVIARFCFIHYTKYLHSIECENILNEISSNHIQDKQKVDLNIDRTKKNILHIFSTVSYGGGHTRLAANWIKNSLEEESHYLLLLHQKKEETPDFLEESIIAANGTIISYQNLNNEIEKAENLRSVSHNFDYIVLHINMDETICNLAFGNKKDFYNLIFMNHADHLFWLGQSISKLYLQLSKSGQVLNYLKRDLQHSAILPIPLNSPKEVYTKESACKELGLDHSKKIFLSIASPYKYIPDENVNFYETAYQLILDSENTILIVIGPDKKNSKEWKDLYDKTNGRIDAIGYVKEKLSLYHFSCDVYLDSFPYGSFTSTLEPALIGKPCVTLSYGSMDVIDSFIEAGFVVDTQQEFIRKAIKLLNKGSTETNETKKIIESYHLRENWQKYLKNAYLNIQNNDLFKIDLTDKEKKKIINRFDNFSIKNSKDVKKYFFIKKIKKEIKFFSFKNRYKVILILLENYTIKNKLKTIFYFLRSFF